MGETEVLRIFHELSLLGDSHGFASLLVPGGQCSADMQETDQLGWATCDPLTDPL